MLGRCSGRCWSRSCSSGAGSNPSSCPGAPSIRCVPRPVELWSWTSQTPERGGRVGTSSAVPWVAQGNSLLQMETRRNIKLLVLCLSGISRPSAGFFLVAFLSGRKTKVLRLEVMCFPKHSFFAFPNFKQFHFMDFLMKKHDVWSIVSVLGDKNRPVLG